MLIPMYTIEMQLIAKNDLSEPGADVAIIANSKRISGIYICLGFNISACSFPYYVWRFEV